MGNDTELNVYCSKPNEKQNEYIVKMKWQPRGYAKVIEWWSSLTNVLFEVFFITVITSLFMFSHLWTEWINLYRAAKFLLSIWFPLWQRHTFHRFLWIVWVRGHVIKAENNALVKWIHIKKRTTWPEQNPSLKTVQSVFVQCRQPKISKAPLFSSCSKSPFPPIVNVPLIRTLFVYSYSIRSSGERLGWHVEPESDNRCL